ncbi:MAG: hypothetical protein JSS30_03795 [Verrucomicrobia bacterium]|nr:hypothetical protein [Verrucomicrobiota bacterium]
MKILHMSEEEMKRTPTLMQLQSKRLNQEEAIEALGVTPSPNCSSGLTPTAAVWTQKTCL